MYIMAVDGCFPKVFAKVHPKYRSPYVSVIVVGVVGIFFIASGSLVIVSAMCAFSQMLCYIIGYISYLVLYKKEPDLNRPWHAPAGKVGAVVSIIAYAALSILAVDRTALPWNLALSVLCIIYIVYAIGYKKKQPPKEAVDEELLALKTAMPSPEEQSKLDKQYLRWRIGAYLAAIVALVAFIIAAVI